MRLSKVLQVYAYILSSRVTFRPSISVIARARGPRPQLNGLGLHVGSARIMVTLTQAYAPVACRNTIDHAVSRRIYTCCHEAGQMLKAI